MNLYLYSGLVDSRPFRGRAVGGFTIRFFKAEIKKVNKDNLTIMANLEIP